MLLLERQLATWPLAIASQALIVAFLIVAGFPIFKSILFMLLVFWAIGLSSLIKFRLLGLKMTPADFIVLAPITFRTLVSDFRIQTAIGLCSAIVAIFAILLLPEPAWLPVLGWIEKIFALIVSFTLFFATLLVMHARKRFTHHILRQGRAHFSAFLAASFGFGPRLKLELAHRSSDRLVFSEPVAARAAGDEQPDIVVVMHESTFDPRVVGLALPETLERFFSPANSKTGRLHVDIFGGSTWQTEFSFYCGVSSQAFGSAANYVFQLLAHKIKSAFPLMLAGQGWQTALISSDERPLPAHENFYRSIGFQRINYPSEYIAGDDLARWARERDDATTYKAALAVLDDQRSRHRPTLISIMTYMNHATHKRQRFLDDRHRKIRDRAVELTSSKAYGEYCVRLAESQKARDEFMENLLQRSKTRPILVLHYGDHQATFVPEATRFKTTDPEIKTTFYSIEGLGMDLHWPDNLPADLHVTYLAAVAQAAGGLPLSNVAATLLDLVRDNSKEWATPKTAAFYQSLLNDGLLRME